RGPLRRDGGAPGCRPAVPRHHAQPRDDVARIDAVRHSPRRERGLHNRVGPPGRHPQARLRAGFIDDQSLGPGRLIHPAVSVWSRVSGRTRKVLAAGLRALSPPLAGEYYKELEDLLVSADMGPTMA